MLYDDCFCEHAVDHKRTQEQLRSSIHKTTQRVTMMLNAACSSIMLPAVADENTALVRSQCYYIPWWSHESFVPTVHNALKLYARALKMQSNEILYTLRNNFIRNMSSDDPIYFAQSLSFLQGVLEAAQNVRIVELAA